MAFFSCTASLHSLSSSILVVTICLNVSVLNVQGTNTLSPGRSTETRSSSENKSAIAENYKTSWMETAFSKILPQPEGTQLRRFMWKEMDETMDDIMHGVIDGAKTMKFMLDSAFSDPPKIARFKKHANYRPSPKILTPTNVKYIIPKVTRAIKVLPSVPKNVVQIVPGKSLIYFEHSTTNKPTVADHSTPSNTYVGNINPTAGDDEEFKIDEKTLREIEKKEEARVEATISAGLPNYQHEEIILGKLKDDWKPVYVETTTTVPIYNTEKPRVVSPLHTNIFDVPFNKSLTDHDNYEVTENSAEETISKPFISHSTNDKEFKRKNSVSIESRNHLKVPLKDHVVSSSEVKVSSTTSTTEHSIRKINPIKLQINIHPTFKSKLSKTTGQVSIPAPTTTRRSPRESPHERFKHAKSEISGNTTESFRNMSRSSRRGSVKFGNKA